jgi:hypothetical protein
MTVRPPVCRQYDWSQKPEADEPQCAAPPANRSTAPCVHRKEDSYRDHSPNDWAEPPHVQEVPEFACVARNREVGFRQDRNERQRDHRVESQGAYEGRAMILHATQRQVQRRRSEAQGTNSEAVGVSCNAMLGLWARVLKVCMALLLGDVPRELFELSKLISQRNAWDDHSLHCVNEQIVVVVIFVSIQEA